MAYWGAERPNQALEAGNTAVEKDPNSVDARRALAGALSFYGEYDAAIQQYEFAIQLHPRLSALYFELAGYYAALGNYDAAIAAYDQVLINDPNSVKAYTRKCETYFTMRSDNLAQEACEQATELDPSYPEAWRQLGMVQYTRKNYEGSIESFETCNRLQNEQGIAVADQEIACYYLQGLAHALLAECDKAWEPLQTGLTILTENPDARIEENIRIGMNLCVNNGDRNPSEIPTAVPPTPVLPEPIGIF
jgi:tetratricopeptide (TPR) repeat protein